MSIPEHLATVAAFIRHQADEHGDRPLLVLGDRRLTYEDAGKRSASLARGLLADGVGKGTRIAVLMPNGPDWVLAWLAAARVGAIVVPINTFYKARELGWVLRHADAAMLLTRDRFLSHDYLQRLEEIAPELGDQSGPPLRCSAMPYLRSVRVWADAGAVLPAWARSGAELASLGDESGIDEAMLAAVEENVSPLDPMVIIYSSGSTADPKGAVHGHGSLLRHARNLNGFRGLRSDDRIYSPMPFFWVGGFVFALLCAMDAGACILAEDVFEPGKTLEYLERERATIVAGWPHYGKAMSEHPDFAKRDLDSIRSGNLYEVLPDGVRPRDPELRANSLGMTETGGPHTIASMEYDLPEELRGSFGKSVPGVEHKVVDPDTRAVLGPGQAGEICVRGYSLMQGLYKVPREDVFDDDGFYHTGDGGYFDADGNLFFQGRLGDVIKTGGANVSPREVEVVLEAIDGVKNAYVVGVPDAARGELVAAAVVPLAGHTLAEETIREGARSELSSYKVPRHIVLCRSEDLPFTDSGKIDKRRLREQLSDRFA